MWRTVASLGGLNGFALADLLGHGRHRPEVHAVTVASPPQPTPTHLPLLSSPITLTDATANGWLGGYRHRSPCFIFMPGKAQTFPTEHVRNVSSGWRNDDFKMKGELVSVTLAHSNTRGKMSTSAKKALKQKWRGKCDTTWWALCIHIAFCSLGPQPMSNGDSRINSHYSVSSRKAAFHCIGLSSRGHPGVALLNLCPWFILWRTVKRAAILCQPRPTPLIISLTKFI